MTRGPEPTYGDKHLHRQIWAAGDYGDVARLHAEPCLALVSRVGISAGMEILDVATGTGNTAIPAAKTGARVVGLDLTPELLEIAAARARAEDVEIEWVHGDAEALPFEDGRFDAVLSSFGVGWAPHHEVAARELVRVLKPAGTIGLCHWSADGNVGRTLQIIPRYLPPSADASTAWLWGDEEHIEELFAGTGIPFEYHRATTRWEFASVEDLMDYWEAKSGPLVQAKPFLEAQGKWEQARGERVELARSANLATDGAWRADQEYLLAIGRAHASGSTVAS